MAKKPPKKDIVSVRLPGREEFGKNWEPILNHYWGFAHKSIEGMHFSRVSPERAAEEVASWNLRLADPNYDNFPNGRRAAEVLVKFLDALQRACADRLKPMFHQLTLDDLHKANMHARGFPRELAPWGAARPNHIPS